MSRTIRIDPRRYIKVPDGKFWHRCKCEWCRSLVKEDYFHKKLPKQLIKEGIEEFNSRYDDNPALEHWLDNNFPTWEEEIWYQRYYQDILDKKELDTKIPFGKLQQELLWALYKSS